MTDRRTDNKTDKWKAMHPLSFFSKLEKNHRSIKLIKLRQKTVQPVQCVHEMFGPRRDKTLLPGFPQNKTQLQRLARKLKIRL